MRSIGPLLVVLLLVGCPGPQYLPDGGLVTDPVDSGSAVDAGRDAGPVDAGSTIDAGFDAGQVIDSGTPDSGSPVDSGIPDAGTPIDAGFDAGLVIDSGTPDAGSPIDAGFDAGIVVIDSGTPDSGTPIDAGQPIDAGPQLGAGQIDGIVTDALTHLPISGAIIDVAGHSVVSSATGTYSVPMIPDGIQLIVRARGPAAGPVYSTTQQEVVPLAGRQTWLPFQLLEGCSEVVQISADAGIVSARRCGPADSRVGLVLPQGGVVDAQGQVVSSVRVELAVLPVALGGRVASNALAAFPGDMQALTATGGTAYLESRGALEVRLRHPTTGAPLQLAAGRRAVLTFSASEVSFDEDTVPAWFFDETQHRWVEEGSTTLVPDPETGAMLHRLEVSHFTFWNADQPTTRTCVTGRVTDPDGGVVIGASVASLGLDYSGSSGTESATTGRFSVFARRSSEVELVSSVRLGSNVAERRLRVRTNADATCIDVGDVIVDPASLVACATGRAVDTTGSPMPGLDVMAQSATRTSLALTGSNGTFCVPVVRRERFDVSVSGSHAGNRVVGRVEGRAAISAAAACGSASCVSVGDIEMHGFTCITGRVLDAVGPVSSARVGLFSRASTMALTSATGEYCAPMEGGASFGVLATHTNRYASSPQSTAQSLVAACGSTSCQTVDLFIGNPGCVSGTVVEQGGAPLEGVQITAKPLAGGHTRTLFTGPGGTFCVPAESGQELDLSFAMTRPGTRFFGSVRATTPSTPGSCGGTGCAVAGTITLTGQSFVGCVTGRMLDSGRPFETRIDVLSGNRVAILRTRRNGTFCVETPVATTLTFEDPVSRSGCARLRSTTIPTTTLSPGSCADETTCLDVGELDFANFCASS